jgi:uncharacterized protein (DUF1501 family)
MPAQNGWSRREFLSTAALSPLAISTRPRAAETPKRNLILLVLTGGPSQLDTWDPKPDAPAEIRGPFRSIPTRIHGVRFTELFPRMAAIADKFSLIRSVHHTAPAVHEVGLQLMQTGQFGGDAPHIGCRLTHSCATDYSVLIPGPIQDTGSSLSNGQGAGVIGSAFDLWPIACTQVVDARYGASQFGQSCALARTLIESGIRCVTVNMFRDVRAELTWDTHGWKPFTTLREMADRVAPDFDRVFSTLLTDLAERGLMDSTMVCAFGEFGRSPRMNHSGGRDHHPGVWTVLMAGGPIQGGRVIGQSDRSGGEVADRPVTPAEIVATLCRGTEISFDAAPVNELF